MKYFALALCAGVALISAPNAASAAAPVACSTLAVGLIGGQVTAATSTVQPASGGTVSYCLVTLTFSTTSTPINVAVGLPLNSVDGGSGGVQGAWNGRTQGLGGGGCSGNLLTGADFPPVINAGYVASGTDLGTGTGFPALLFGCTPGVTPANTYNTQYIDDFIRVAIKQQILYAKSVTNTYFGAKPAYNYWNGCSTGGRQGYLLAQELGNELEGILASAPAMYWTRFQTAQMWGEIAMKDLAGETANGAIPTAKLNFATSSAVAACDGNDGILDGVIDDPRTCTFSTKALICTANGGPSSDPNCLTPGEAQAIDRIWDGPRNANGNKIWFGLDRGTDLTGLNGTPPFPLGITQFQWDEHNLAFDWHTVTMFGAGGTKSYAGVAQDGSTNTFTPGVSLADETDTFGNLDTFKNHGGKLLTFVGGNDQLIMPRGVINYYRQMASHFDNDHDPDFKNLQKFYRLFRAPGVGHCGGGAGPQPQNLFDALVNWVEHGVAPSQILAQGGAVATRTRPLCPYPQTAIYDGSGSTDVAANFHCGGNLESRKTVCADVLVKYKQETNGPLDFRGTGLDHDACGDRDDHGHGDDDDHGHGDRD